MTKETVEKYLDEHQFQYKWHKDYLFIKKLGIGWKIPLVEFEYSVTPINEIIASFTSKPGNSFRHWEGDTLYSLVVD